MFNNGRNSTFPGISGRLRSATSALVVCVTLFLSQSLYAADHREAPAVTADPAADLADIFAWTTPDAERVNLVLTIPAAMFSDAAQYVLHVESSDAFGNSGTVTDIICTFATDQTIQCWIGDDEYLTGDASQEIGLESETGRTRVFAGLRNDPFFFNADGFNDTIAAVNAAAPGLTFDGAGCPVLDNATSNALITTLATGGDAFALGNVLALVLQIDKDVLTSGGPILAVWGATHRG